MNPETEDELQISTLHSDIQLFLKMIEYLNGHKFYSVDDMQVAVEIGF